MFEFFKNLFVSKPSEGEDVFEQKVDTNRSSGVARSTTVQRSHFQPDNGDAPIAHANGGSSIDIPLQMVLSGLPTELRGRVQQVDVGDATISIPLDKILAQLPLGSVKLTFGELRRAGPQLFTSGSDCDQIQVPLPLNEILVRINPGMLVRRNQKRIDVPEEIGSPFGERGQGLIFTIQPSKGSPAPAPAPARSVTPTTPAAPVQPKPEPVKSAPVAPAKSPAPVHAKSVPPAPVKGTPLPPAKSPATGPAKSAPLAPGKSPAAAPASPRPVQSTPTPSAPPTKPIASPIPSAPVAPVTPATPPGPIPFKMDPFQPTPTLRPAAGPVHTPRPVAPPSAAPPLPPPSAPSQRPPLAPASPIGMPQALRPAMPQPVKPVAPVAPVAAPVVPVAPAPVAVPVPEGPFLIVGMAPLLEGWPEALRHEVLQLNLLDTKVGLPVPILEQSLKRGKVAVPWKALRSWIRPAPLPMESAHDEVILELPLKVILPLFLAHKKQEPKASQQKVEIDENIPNLFFGFPQAEGSGSGSGTDFVRAQGVASVQAPSAPGLAAAQPAVPPAASDTNYYVWDDNADSARVDESDTKRSVRGGTDLTAKYATPNEIVSRAAALEGVAGALVALPDGLMVASKVSTDLNGDTLAAFLPQIFGKVSQCTKELRMGELNNLNFTVGNVPWKIFRVNAIFFAAFGRVGQALPTAQLASLAAELDHKR